MKSFAVRIAAIMLLLLCGSIFAVSGEELPALQVQNTPPAVTVNLSYDSERLFNAFARSRLYGRPLSAFLTARRTLNDFEKQVYDYIAAQAELVADGKRTDTVIIYNAADMKTRLTEQDLGISSLVDEEENWKDDEISAALQNYYDAIYNWDRVLNALTKDHPYAFYWLSNREGSNIYVPYNHYGYRWIMNDSGEWETYVEIENDFGFGFAVDGEYAAEGQEHMTDPAKTGAVTAAVENAKRIIAGGAGKSDYQRLLYYAKRLREESDYNYEAAEDPYYPSTGPWQMIWALDGDPDTKVVCEGYSEAFQYLCDNTGFIDPALQVSTVEGVMTDSSGGGGNHEWNLVHTPGGGYIADVTNFEEASDCVYLFFQVPYAGSAEEGYWFDRGWDLIGYRYNEDYYDLRDLALTDIPYSEPQLRRTELTLAAGDILLLHDETGRVPNALCTEDSVFSVKVSDPDVIDADGDRITVLSSGTSEVTLCGARNTTVITVTVPEELPALVLPQSLAVLGEEALQGTAAVRLVLPDGLTDPEPGAFSGLTGLSQIVITGAGVPDGLPLSEGILYLCRDPGVAGELAEKGLSFLIIQ